MHDWKLPIKDSNHFMWLTREILGDYFVLVRNLVNLKAISPHGSNAFCSIFYFICTMLPLNTSAILYQWWKQDFISSRDSSLRCWRWKHKFCVFTPLPAKLQPLKKSREKCCKLVKRAEIGLQNESPFEAFKPFSISTILHVSQWRMWSNSCRDAIPKSSGLKPNQTF